MSFELNDYNPTFFQEQPSDFHKKTDDDCNRTLSNQSESEDNNLILNNFSLLTKTNDEPELQPFNRNVVYERMQENSISRTHEEEMKIEFPKSIFLVEKNFKPALNEIQLSKDFSEKINQELFYGRKMKESIDLFTIKKGGGDSISKYIQ